QWLEPSPLTDWYAANQGLPYEPAVVNDFLVSLHFESESTASFELQAEYMNKSHTVRLLPKSVAKSEHDGRHTLSYSWLAHIGFCDGRLLLGSEGEEQVVDLRDADPGDIQTVASPAVARSPASFYLRCLAGQCTISQVIVRRDLFIRTSSRTGLGRQHLGRIPVGSYFVLGDNIPASRDGRHELGFVPRDQIIAKPLKSSLR
ncbi:MAG: hypothetical protein KDA51_02460, partial [Planctomycetales bacterium]|nr:hypothetical protein [Planctomycetales bacterium]